MLGDKLTAALAQVDRAYFCQDDQGELLHQISAPHVITRMLRLLEVEEGSRVLEIGTGSGYSTALLAELSGPDGAVVSIDVDLELTSRARRLLGQKGYRHVELICADGRRGWRERGLYDRVIAWCSVMRVPQAWRDQSRPGAIFIVPMLDAERPWIGKYRRSVDAALVEEDRFSGGFIPATAIPFRPWEGESVRSDVLDCDR